MSASVMSRTGRFCWVDLAARDAGRAKSFYRDLFGWTAEDVAANGGTFTRLLSSGDAVGSIYQIGHVQRERGMPSHWTPYVQVDDVDAAVRRAAAFGGSVLVQPFTVDRIAHIALIADAIGAPVGLWQPAGGEGAHG